MPVGTCRLERLLERDVERTAHRHPRLLHRHRGEPRRPGDVTGGVDALGGGLEVRIHADAPALVHLDAGLGQPEPLHVSGAADRV